LKNKNSQNIKIVSRVRKYILSLQAQWFTRAFCSEVMKRESGENPEQTRCCKLHTSPQPSPEGEGEKEKTY
jgi:hypothetical protein